MDRTRFTHYERIQTLGQGVRRDGWYGGTSLPIEGTVAACIRANLGQKSVRFVDSPIHHWIERCLDASVRDSHPAVQKAVRRLSSAWALHAPNEATQWAIAFRGGLPKMIRLELEKSARKGTRLMKQRQASDS